MSQRLLYFALAWTLTGCQASVEFFSTQNPSTPGGGNGPTSGEPLTALRFGDRTYVASVLTNIFVPPTTGLTSEQMTERQLLIDRINTLVANEYSNFGRRCDFFTSSTEGCTNTSNPPIYNYNASNLVVGSFALSTPLRSALSLRAIYGLIWFRTQEVGLKTAIANTRTLVQGVPVAMSSVDLVNLQLPTEDEIIAAFKLVYRGVDPSSETVERLTNLVSESYNALASQSYPAPQTNGRIRDTWRFLFAAILASSIWQAP